MRRLWKGLMAVLDRILNAADPESSSLGGPIDVRVEIAAEVYDEIRRDVREHPRVEVGGKYVGVLSESFKAADPQWQERLAGLTIHVRHQLDAGPRARRTPVSHHPDADYQVSLFRHLEQEFPEIEHLGSWHSHHPNGLNRLSGGDIDHYFRAVNRPDHNHDLFLASLVTDVTGLSRARHFLFVRGHQQFYEIAPERVTCAGTPSPYHHRMAGGRTLLHARHQARSALSPVSERARRRFERDRTWLETDFRADRTPAPGTEWTGEALRPDGVARIGYRVPGDYPDSPPVGTVERHAGETEIRLVGTLSGEDPRDEMQALISAADDLARPGDER